MSLLKSEIYLRAAGLGLHFRIEGEIYLLCNKTGIVFSSKDLSFIDQYITSEEAKL